MKVLYFSTVNWKWIKQRPHFICEGLSEKGIDIEYISLTPFLKQKKQKKIKINEHLTINDQYVIPFASKNSIIERINISYIEQIINKKYDVIIITHPLHYHYLKKALRYNPKVIYECMDNMPYFYEGIYQEKIKRLENEICKKVDFIITSSHYLKDKIIDEYTIAMSKIAVIPNAVDSKIQFKSKNEETRSTLRLKEKNLVYIGTVGKWLDLELIYEYAKENPTDSIYLVGPIDIGKQVNATSNIEFVGSVAHEHIADIIKQAEILLIPFKIDELIRGVDPVKIYEYKAFGKYIISSWWEELEKHNDNKCIMFYKTKEEFKESINQARGKFKQQHTKIDKKYINQNSWSSRVKKYIGILEIINK